MMWWSGVAVAAECAAGVEPAAIDAHLAAAEKAYADLDGSALAAALDRVAIDLPCLSRVVPPLLAARYHRDLALLAWGEGREADARSELAALARSAPGSSLPTDLVPAGHALHQALTEATALRPEAAPEPRDGSLWFDGVATTLRPGEPSVAQLELGGHIVFTERLTPGEPLPPYDAKPSAAAVGTARRHPWVGVAVGTVGLAALVGAYIAEASFQSYEPGAGTSGDDALRALHSRRLAAGALSVTAGAGVAGGVVVGVVRW